MFKGFVIGNLFYKLSILDCNYNEYLMSTDGKYASHFELEYISRLYPDTTFCVYKSNDFTELVDYGLSAVM